METELVGTLAPLPDGQLVKIEKVYLDGFALVRRLDGEWSGAKAVCALTWMRYSRNTRIPIYAELILIRIWHGLRK